MNCNNYYEWNCSYLMVDFTINRYVCLFHYSGKIEQKKKLMGIFGVYFTNIIHDLDSVFKACSEVGRW